MNATLDRHGNPTDDADRMVGGCDVFGPGDDYDPVYSGFDDYDPAAPDYENKPYGWGVERFEDANALRIARELRNTWPQVCGREIDRDDPCESLRIALRWTGFDARLERVSDRVWGHCCGECGTHAEAVAKYAAWAEKVTRRRGR